MTCDQPFQRAVPIIHTPRRFVHAREILLKAEYSPKEAGSVVKYDQQVMTIWYMHVLRILDTWYAFHALLESAELQ